MRGILSGNRHSLSLQLLIESSPITFDSIKLPSISGGDICCLPLPFNRYRGGCRNALKYRIAWATFIADNNFAGWRPAFIRLPLGNQWNQGGYCDQDHLLAHDYTEGHLNNGQGTPRAIPNQYNEGMYSLLLTSQFSVTPAVTAALLQMPLNSGQSWATIIRLSRLPWVPEKTYSIAGRPAVAFSCNAGKAITPFSARRSIVTRTLS